MATKQWSAYQTAIFDHVKNEDGHLVVRARAGTGKTTTSIEAMKYMDGTVAALAFGAEIARTLKERVPEGVDARTFHSFGLRALTKGTRKKIRVGAKSTPRHCAERFKQLQAAGHVLPSKPWLLGHNLARAVDMAKADLVPMDDMEALDAMLDAREIDVPPGFSRPQWCELIGEEMAETARGNREIDFSDMIWLPLQLGVKFTLFDNVIADEAQDLTRAQRQIALHSTKRTGRLMAVGDDRQCIESSTPIAVPGGTRRAADLCEGETILAYRNGEVVEQTVRHVAHSSWAHGLKVTTESGRTCTMSPNHKIWASRFEFEENCEEHMFVYLMHRPGFGFRIGVTNKDQSDSAPYGSRPHSERADRMWLLEICTDREAALERETWLSLEYGIPTAVFNGESRGINQNRLNNIFKEFGQNGMQLLEDRNLSFDLPHWMSYSVSKGSVVRRTVQMVAHGAKGTNVTLEWSGEDLDARLEKNYTFSKLPNGRRRLRRWFANYRHALAFAEGLSQDAEANLMRRLAVPDSEPLRLLTASALFCGMSIPVKTETGIELDRIESIESVPGSFVDLDVDDASNFFGGGILSHNSIYVFRGAGIDSMDQFINILEAPVLPLPICYRCPKQVIRLAQRIVPDIEWAPSAGDGEVDEGEHLTVDDAQPGDMVISRTNAELMALCLRWLAKGKPASIVGNEMVEKLKNFIINSKCDSSLELLKYTQTWAENETARLLARERSTLNVEDRVACIAALTRAAATTAELLEILDRVTDAANIGNAIRLSTAHRAKGLEFPRVWILQATFDRVRARVMRNNGRIIDEDNLQYVALTRAMESLYITHEEVIPRKGRSGG